MSECSLHQTEQTMSASFSIDAFLPDASLATLSTSSIVVALATEVATAMQGDDPTFVVPAKIESPGALVTGRASPVSADSSKAEVTFWSQTLASHAGEEPLGTNMRSPTSRRSASIGIAPVEVCIESSDLVYKYPTFDFVWAKAFKASLVRPFDQFSRYRPQRMKNSCTDELMSETREAYTHNEEDRYIEIGC